MNKKLFLLVTFILSLGLGFTACGDDDKDEPTVDYAAQIAGTYNGELVVDLGTAGGEQDPITQDIKIERLAENKIKLSVTDFIFPGLGTDPIGNIEIETTVSENNGTIILTDKSGQEVSLLDGVLKGKAALSSASVKDKKLGLKIDVTEIKMSGAPGVPDVKVSFTGNKK